MIGGCHSNMSVSQIFVIGVVFSPTMRRVVSDGLVVMALWRLILRNLGIGYELLFSIL